MDSGRIKCVSCIVDLMIINDVDLLQLQIILLLRWCLRFDLFGYNFIEKWVEMFRKVKVRNTGTERKVFNGHHDIGMDRTSYELKWHYQMGFRYVWSICVCECLWYQEWECAFVGRSCSCHVEPLVLTECLKYVMFIMNYCPSWTFSVALCLTMSHEHTYTLRPSTCLACIHWVFLPCQKRSSF